MRVAILGCGPAGLFAAHAAVGQGADVRILSKARKSFMRGAQYLHRPIPGLSRQPFQIDYRLDGPVEGYREKVYGDMSDVQVSPETLTGVANAWDIREAYDAAWSEYSDRIIQWDAATAELGILPLSYDLVINTIPLNMLCHRPDEHEFRSQKIWSTDYVKHIGVFEETPEAPIADNVVVCSGYEDDWWYRQSRIHGWENTEFPHNHKPAGKSWEVLKPIDTNCDCWHRFHHMGRYGRWTKGILSDSAFYDTEALIVATREREAYAARFSA